MFKLTDVRWTLRHLDAVLEGRWQPMFWGHLEFLMYFFERAVSRENGDVSWRWEAMFGPEIALGDMLQKPLGLESTSIFTEMVRWLNMSVYGKELGLPWHSENKRRSCM